MWKLFYHCFILSMITNGIYCLDLNSCALTICQCMCCTLFRMKFCLKHKNGCCLFGDCHSFNPNCQLNLFRIANWFQNKRYIEWIIFKGNYKNSDDIYKEMFELSKMKVDSVAIEIMKIFLSKKNNDNVDYCRSLRCEI